MPESEKMEVSITQSDVDIKKVMKKSIALSSQCIMYSKGGIFDSK